MRLLLGLAPVLAVILCFPTGGRDHEPLEDCPEDTVCLIFNKPSVKCFVDGKKASNSYIWKSEKTTKTSCPDRNYATVWARLDIRPLNLKKWKLYAALYEKINDEEVLQPKDFAFKFKNAEIAFIDRSRAQFSWSKEGNYQTANVSLNDAGKVKSQDYKTILKWEASPEFIFNRYSFEIEANGEKLIDFIGPEIVLIMRKDNQIQLTDSTFPALIGKLTTCNKSEIKNACHGSCDQIVFTGQNVKCRSTLWYAKNDWSEDWRSVDQLNCSMGYWQAEWGGESVYVDSSIALECSAIKPESPYASTRLGIIVGCTVGGVILLALALVGVFFLIRFFKRREGDKPTTKRVPSFRICDFPSPLNESAKSPGDTVPEYTAHTFESKTLSEKTATAKFGKQSVESTGGGKKGRLPSTGTASMKFDTATFTPSFQDAPY